MDSRLSTLPNHCICRLLLIPLYPAPRDDNRQQRIGCSDPEGRGGPDTTPKIAAEETAECPSGTKLTLL